MELLRVWGFKMKGGCAAAAAGGGGGGGDGCVVADICRLAVAVVVVLGRWVLH